MIAYLPTLYKDELFSSFEARFHSHTLSHSTDSTYRRLYGRTGIKKSLYFPTYLGTFVKRIEHTGLIDFNGIVARHTLWPVFFMFFRPEHQRKILKLMESGHFPSFNGLPSSIIRDTRSFNPVPKYCPQCNLESIKNHGEIFFNRVHQLPNITVCPYHFCYLNNCEIQRSYMRKDAIVVPSLTSCPCTRAKPSSNRRLNLNSRFFLPIIEMSNDAEIDYKAAANYEFDRVTTILLQVRRKLLIKELHRMVKERDKLLQVKIKKMKARLRDSID